MILLLFLIAGCERYYSLGVDDYVVRLARVLDQELPEQTTSNLEHYPRTRDLRIIFESEGLDLLEFLRIGECELQALVAERNSSLGRLALPSQQLIYELGVLRTGEACVLSITENDPELASKLTSVLAAKRKELPGRIWQATIGSKEFKSYWSPAPIHDLNEAVSDAEVILALTHLAADIERWLSGDHAADSTRLEGQLNVIRQGRGGGQLLLWQELRDELPRGTYVLRTRVEVRPLCYPGMKTSAADIFRNVVMNGFVGRLQKDVARLNRSSLEQMNLIRRIEAAVQTAHLPAYEKWQKSRDELLQSSWQSITDHTRALEPLMQQCGFLPET